MFHPVVSLVLFKWNSLSDFFFPYTFFFFLRLSHKSISIANQTSTLCQTDLGLVETAICFLCPRVIMQKACLLMDIYEGCYIVSVIVLQNGLHLFMCLMDCLPTSNVFFCIYDTYSVFCQIILNITFQFGKNSLSSFPVIPKQKLLLFCWQILYLFDLSTVQLLRFPL